MKRLAIFVSGSGTNMENLIRKNREGVFLAEIVFVLTDNPEAKAIEKADYLKVPVIILPRKKISTKEEFERQITAHIDAQKIDLIILAGFMRILSPEFVKRYPERIINIHPSLLPAFPGAHAIQEAYRNFEGTKREMETGVTVHYVTEQVDGGPVILQRKVPIYPNDTLEILEARIHTAEYQIYPEALKKILFD